MKKINTSILKLARLPILALFSITILVNPNSSVASKETYQPEPLFVCQQNSEAWMTVSIHTRLHGIGPQKFIGRVFNQENGQSFISRLNLTKYFEGRVLFFSSGDVRVRFDRTRMKENKTKSFVQIPNWDVYTDEWTCKGPSFEENPF